MIRMHIYDTEILEQRFERCQGDVLPTMGVCVLNMICEFNYYVELHEQ